MSYEHSSFSSQLLALSSTHGDVIAFSILGASGQPLDWRMKGNMRPLGVSDGYPQPASITTLTFTDDDERLPAITYQKPYSS